MLGAIRAHCLDLPENMVTSHHNSTNEGAKPKDEYLAIADAQERSNEAFSMPFAAAING